MSKKHKRHKLSSCWSPYDAYAATIKPIPSHIDVQGGEDLKPLSPVEAERLMMTSGRDSEDWGMIE